MSRFVSKTLLAALLAVTPAVVGAQQISSSAADAQKDSLLKEIGRAHV